MTDTLGRVPLPSSSPTDDQPGTFVIHPAQEYSDPDLLDFGAKVQSLACIVMSFLCSHY